jgi:hypothetical protein
MAKIDYKARSSVEKFQLFASALDDNSWLDYNYKGALNLKLIGSLCGISRSTLYSNEHLKSEIIKIGTSLLDKGIIQVLPYEKDEKVIKARSTHVTKNSKELEQLRSENQRLNNRVNELIAQLDDKNNKLSKFEVMEKVLGETGRIPR